MMKQLIKYHVTEEIAEKLKYLGMQVNKIPSLPETMEWLRINHNLMCVSIPYATTEGILYAYKIYSLDHKDLKYVIQHEKADFNDPDSALLAAISRCLETIKPKENQIPDDSIGMVNHVR